MEILLLHETQAVNPWAAGDSSNAWMEVGENLRIACNLEEEISGRTVRLKVATMLKHFSAQNRRNLKK